MATVDLGVSRYLDRSNNTKNDYSYHSGWNPSAILGQQYKFWKGEAQALVKDIDKHAFYRDADLRAEVLRDVHSLTTTKAAHSMPKGSVALSRSAADVLNAYAKKLGANLHFTSGQPRPMHPVG